MSQALLPLACGIGPFPQGPVFGSFLSHPDHLIPSWGATTSLCVGFLSPECAALTFTPGTLGPACLQVTPAELCCQVDLPMQLFVPQQRGGPGASGGKSVLGTQLHRTLLS